MRRRSMIRWLVVLGVVAVLATAPTARAHAPEVPPGVVPTIVARALPAVVSIVTRHIEQDQFNQRVVRRGLGSGVIVDPRGFALTNLHVVEDAHDIKVSLADGRRFRGSFVGGDRFSELAVVKIDGAGGAALPTLRLGDARRLAIGEPVIAIGNPLWIEGGPTVTVGIVSGLGRSLEEPDLPILHNLIQTDAAINPGNSGGPLLDLDGHIVGINTALIPSAHGIGFAVPAATARPVLQALIATGRVVRPSVGLSAVSLTAQVAYANDLPMERGALVTRVDPDGPAAAAGVQPRDVVVEVGGRAVRDLHHLHELVQTHRIGETVRLGLWREGRALLVDVTLAEYR